MEDNKVVQGQQEEFAEEMQEAQKTGIVSMEDKKKEKKTRGPTFSKSALFIQSPG